MRGLAHGLQALGILEQRSQAIRQSSGIPRRDDKAIEAFGNNATAIRSGDNRQAVGHRLELRECEAIRDRRQNKNIRAFVELAHAIAGHGAVETHIRRGFYDELVSDGNGAGYVDLDVFSFQEFCCLEEVWDAFAKIDLSEK